MLVVMPKIHQYTLLRKDVIIMLNSFDAAYHGLCEEILKIGNQRDDRTHTGTISKFGHQLRFDLSKGFPLLTTKKYLLNSWQQNYYGLLKEIQI